MAQKLILNRNDFNCTLTRLCCQIIEKHPKLEDTVLVGLQPRGIILCDRISGILQEKFAIKDLKTGKLDITFFRDDFRTHDKPLIPKSTEIDFMVEGKTVIMIDDVLYTGRSVRSGLDAILAFGRPAKVELLVLIDRKYSRDLPIQPDYTGKAIDSIMSDKVKVKWSETDQKDEVWLLSNQD
ncbi:MAG TPA: bifunctional pyr operon transcriptional regulator/uracil phosphoribosyltransferase PyrR [Bacteroidia bacterium]|nr:bifunctional pyr operon transcriptional regulator/uracil phosphoribosyltransferase PyrR [Bacteroidia bacterium]HNT79621.1 bifunctional pyr operon transcriptional regulator/uracil phosphoribosyltransferase PyrR [Bacteroidia bacterium]